MAYTVVITKQEVTQKSTVVFSIKLRTVVNDGESDVFDEEYSIEYNTNSSDMSGLISELLKRMKVDWDAYIANKNIYDATALDNAISTMQSQATTYVNS